LASSATPSRPSSAHGLALDPAGAKAAALAIEPGDARNRAIGTIISQLGGRDPEGSQKLLDELPEGQSRNQGIRYPRRIVGLHAIPKPPAII
jgi:hypothetical protein